jgi:ADP-ribosylglycohydrolase
MRITPLAIWAHKLEDHDIDKAVREEVSLTHSNEIAQQAAVCHCICIKNLIQFAGNTHVALINMK